MPRWIGIPVNAIAPNYLYSEAYFPKAKFIDNPIGKNFIREVVPAGRLGEPEEIGDAWMLDVGHKGKSVGVLGYYPDQKPRFRFELINLDKFRFDTIVKVLT